MKRRIALLFISTLLLAAVCLSALSCQLPDDHFFDADDTASLADRLTNSDTAYPSLDYETSTVITAPVRPAPETDEQDVLPVDPPEAPNKMIVPVNGTLLRKHDPEYQVYNPTTNDYRVHLGIDIETAAEAPVYAAADGVIEKIWTDTLYGYCLAIHHGQDVYSIYKNLDLELPESISTGTYVRVGQLIAIVGDSAMIEIADPPHLHFEVTKNDLAVDPLTFFDDAGLKAIGFVG